MGKIWIDERGCLDSPFSRHLMPGKRQLARGGIEKQTSLCIMEISI